MIVAWRRDLDIPVGYGFPQPPLGAIGDLVPNVTITARQSAGFVTTRDAIADLPRLEAGEQVDTYTGPPESAYQVEMRSGLNSELFNHYAARLSSVNLARLAMLDPGQD